MPYRQLADLVVIFHFAVVIFVIAGGMLVLRWKWVAWVHLPVIAWVIFAELFQRTCPLTYLENAFRERGGAPVYGGDFVGHYIMPVLYPRALTASMQLWIGAFIFLSNVAIYIVAFRRHRHPTALASPSPSTPSAA